MSKFEPLEDEYVGDDGRLYCKKCNTLRTFCKDEFEVRCLCKCKSEEIEKREEQELQRRKLEKLKEMKDNSLLGERYKDKTFDNLEIRSQEHAKIIDRLKNYCLKFENNTDGIGIYLYGNIGSGKTVLTACMVDLLIKNYIECFFTNIGEIKTKLLGKNSQDYLYKLKNCQVLFIDDFGTENVKKNNEDSWCQEIIYDIVNSRYNNMLPIIYTSNYSLKECIEEKGILKKTIDRIYESTEQIKLELQSFRIKNKKNLYF